MREGGGRGVGRWRLLGRLLPAEIRERIFEPAFGDLLRSHLAPGRGARRTLPFPVHVAGTFLGCVGIALPHLIVRRGKLTRLARVGLSVVAMAAVVLLVLVRMAGKYGGY